MASVNPTVTTPEGSSELMPTILNPESGNFRDDTLYTGEIGAVAPGDVVSVQLKVDDEFQNTLSLNLPIAMANLVPVRTDDDDDQSFRVVATCSDTGNPGATLAATLNGTPVVDGQVLSSDDDGLLGDDDDGPRPTLVVTCTDTSGYIGTATATPPVSGDDGDDDW